MYDSCIFSIKLQINTRNSHPGSKDPGAPRRNWLASGRVQPTPMFDCPRWPFSWAQTGSGKTTLLRALVDLGRIVASPAETVHLLPFLSDQTRWEPTVFSLEGEADFLTPGETPQKFRYELTIGRRQTDDGSEAPLFVSRETLVHFPRGRRRRLFDRGPPGTPIYVSRDFGLTARRRSTQGGRSRPIRNRDPGVSQRARGHAFRSIPESSACGHDQYPRQRHMGSGYLCRYPVVGGRSVFQKMGAGTDPAERPGR